MGYESWAFNFKHNEKFKYNVEDWDEFRLHCYPEISQLVEKVSQIIKSLDSPVNKVLLMTNADQAELSDLKNQFKQNEVQIFIFEPKLELIPEDVNWNMAHSLSVEMELAIRGQYFIGNRHSSIASNLFALRGIDKEIESSYLI
jgi:hypothetical protein